MKKIAILILAHKAPHQLLRLINRFNSEKFDVFVHLDSKSDKRLFENVLSKCDSNVYLQDKRIDTQLVDFSLVVATLELVKAATARNEYLYYALLTGQDYPIKSSEYIYGFLCENYPMSFIDMYGCDEAYRRGVLWTGKLGNHFYSQKIRRFFRALVGYKFYYSHHGKYSVRLLSNIFDRMVSLIRKSPREEIKQTKYTYSFGSHFWILPDNAINFLLQTYTYDLKINKIFNHIAAPEESYFQTVLSAYSDLLIPEQYSQFNNPDDEMDNPALRLIKWYENGNKTNGHPAIWKIGDLAYISSRKALFARKFDEEVDSIILDSLDNI